MKNEQKTYDRHTAKFIATLIQNMPRMSDDVMQGWIQNPTSLQKVLESALCPPDVIPDFKVWKTIKLGTSLKNVDDFRKALRAGEYQISNLANDILGKPKFAVAAKETEIELVKVSVKELGFNREVSWQEIYHRVQGFGLKRCPSEVGPQLRLQYSDQPCNESLLIAMEPITDLNGNAQVFCVVDGVTSPCLSVDYGGLDNFLNIHDQLVFCK